MQDPAGAAILAKQSQRQIGTAFYDNRKKTLLRQLWRIHYHHQRQNLQPNDGSLPGLRESQSDLLQHEELT
jgi:hypothetical protein